MAAMKPNAVAVLNFLKENHHKDVIAAEVAEALGLGVKQVNGIFTSFQKKQYGVRIPAEMELEDGTHKAVKILKLTDAGMAVDPATEGIDAE